ncbi:histone deacetylase family protein [uncultured Tateyamaria sp.]|uniref:histone deacetylase family protein n=1 Tax=uncultured Tateyamaria sp. TaxID=455651 RepID=UPI00260B6C5B|nr:histone deacetylase family protein [uncultured Tateyamaria sp.]
MSTALLTHADGLLHVTPTGMPEQVARLAYIQKALADLDVLRVDPPLAEDASIALCHPQDYIDSVRAKMPADGFAGLDRDTDAETFLCPTSGNAIWRAAGGAVHAVDMVLDGVVQNAFVAMRPPGHHAEQSLPMGFCIFGNVAIAAKHALEARGLSRVAVVDFDVHHGNGTQALLQDDPRALVITSQQMPLWPGTGVASDRGPHGTVLNIPLAPGTDGAHAIAEYQRLVIPALAKHAPDLILVSAGFDAHQDDPLAQLNWTADTYTRLTDMIAQSARDLCKGRVVSVLEGGYDLDALALCARAHVQSLIKATL